MLDYFVGGDFPCRQLSQTCWADHTRALKRLKGNLFLTFVSGVRSQVRVIVERTSRNKSPETNEQERAEELCGTVADVDVEDARTVRNLDWSSEWRMVLMSMTTAALTKTQKQWSKGGFKRTQIWTTKTLLDNVIIPKGVPCEGPPR